ncbi:hypothetical protein [Klebsiella pneumoniae]|uniref:hypothetical protein n=1 Tax=Klebsiella pneumoniae TaxID=573 RepID=UPI00203D657A|nr:hypothetical protein [Klebsiella pneumoniae]USB65953.1 hypothetical protein KU669_03600 [Klebsiella pneumoniae]
MNKKRTISPVDMSCQGNMMEYVISKMISGMSFISIVRVIEINDDGTIDLENMLHETNANGESLNDGGKFYNIPFLRLLRGNSAIIMDPVVGDIGLMAVCDRDTTLVRKSKSPSIPGSERFHNYADGVYLTSISTLNEHPTQFIEFNENGITVNAPMGLHVIGNVTTEGSITASGDVIGGGISLDNHVHGGVTSGGSTTSGPQ